MTDDRDPVIMTGSRSDESLYEPKRPKPSFFVRRVIYPAGRGIAWVIHWLMKR